MRDSFSNFSLITHKRHNLHDLYVIILQLAQITVTVDGGAHRWLKYLEEHGINLSNDEHKQYIPDLVTGDMDSCPPDIIEKLRNIGSTIVKTPDQNHTDYTKALLQVAHYAKTRNINVILKIYFYFFKIIIMYMIK